MAGEWSLSTPSGQDVSCSKENPYQSCYLLQEGGNVLDACLTLGNELSKETRKLTKQVTLLGRGAHGESSRVGNPGELLCSMAGIRFYVMGLVSGSFLVAHALLSQDECQGEGFWEVEGHVALPFDLSWTLLVVGGLLVSFSLPGPPVVK